MNRFLSWFENLINPFPLEEPQTPPSTIFAFCWHYSKSIWPWLLMMSVFSATIAIFEVVVFGFFGNIVDWLAAAERETFLEKNMNILIFMGILTVILIPLLTFFGSLILHQTVIGNYPMIIRWQAHRYLLGQSMQFYQDEFAGRIATKVMQAALGVREAVLKIIEVFVYVIVYFLSALVLIASLNVYLLFPFIVWLILYSTFLYILVPRMTAISRRQADARSTMTGRIVDSYTNIATVKLFSHAGREREYAKESMKDFLDTVHPQMRLATATHVGMSILNHFLLFAVGAIAIWQWLDGATAVASVAVAAALATRLTGMSDWIMWEMSGLFESIGMAIDGMNTIAQPCSVTDKPDAPNLKVKDGEIKFENVTFNYDFDHKETQENDEESRPLPFSLLHKCTIIESMNLNIKGGEKVGLIGHSGAGKTTLLNILLRLYDLDSGSVLIDGQNISDVSQESLRSQIAVVTQDTSLLHRSVGENIAYGRLGASENDIVAATKRANAHEFIMELQDNMGRKGYDARVGERGVKLSGGQRQRIAIARVFLKDAPILVLDEATSALDSQVEAVIQEQLFNLMEGKTVLAIAHRLSTIASLDRLIILQEGKIIEEGTHSDLVNNGGLYADLWQRQSGGFLSLDSSFKSIDIVND